MSKTNKLPLVSIITPSFNQGEFIKETIESVLNQDYPNIEHIIVDAQSTDNTLEILNSYGERIKYISEKDDGQADAVNKGIQMSSGSIIGWLNSDDTYYSGAVSSAVDYLIKHQSTDIVYGEANFINKDGSVKCRYGTEPYNREGMACSCIICQPSAFFRREAVEEVGYLNKDLQYCMDYELWMRLGINHQFSYIEKLMATSRLYQENKTMACFDEMCREVFCCLLHYYKYVPIDWVRRYVDYIAEKEQKTPTTAYIWKKFVLINKFNPIYVFSTIGKHALWRIIAKTFNQTDLSVYADGWAQQLCAVHPKIEDNSTNKQSDMHVEIHGEHLWPLSKPLVLKIKINSNKAYEYTISEFGDFHISIKLQYHKKRRYKLYIKANDSFIPSVHGMGPDYRKLSYKINSVVLKGEK